MYRKKIEVLLLRLGLTAITSMTAMTAMAEEKEKVYHHSEDGAPRSLDPVALGDTYSSLLVTGIYDTLLEYQYLRKPYALKPNLSDGMPTISKDGLTITVKLKKGVLFHDDACFPGGKGREVVAEDVVYSLKRHFDPANSSRGRWLWNDRIKGLDEWGKNGADYNKPVAGLEIKDKHTLQIHLKKRFPQFLYTLAMGFAAVVPKESVAKYGKEISVKPVGSGPWKLAEFDNKKAELVRNKSYRDEFFDLEEHGYEEALHGYTGVAKLKGMKLPIMDRIEVSFMEQEAARWNSFTKGDEIQYGLLPVNQLEHVLESKNPVKLKKKFAEKYQMRAAREMGYVYVEFNMNSPEFGYDPDPKQNERKKALRCAMRKAYNWDARVKRMYHGIGEAFAGIIPPEVDGYDPAISRDSVTLDIAGAKKLLKDHGWNEKNLPVIFYSGVASVKHRQFYAQFRSWMSKIGYPKKKIRLKNFATFGDYIKAKSESQLSMHGLGWGLDYPDAENVLQLYYGPNKSPGSNSANYNNPEYDKVYEQALLLGPGPERAALYRKANQILIDDCVVISGFSRTRIHLWHKDLAMFPDRGALGNYFKYVGYDKKKIKQSA